MSTTSPVIERTDAQWHALAFNAKQLREAQASPLTSEPDAHTFGLWALAIEDLLTFAGRSIHTGNPLRKDATR